MGEKRNVLRKPSPAPAVVTNPREHRSASGQEHGTRQSPGTASSALAESCPFSPVPPTASYKRLQGAPARRVPFTVTGAAHPAQTMPWPWTFAEPCPGPRSPPEPCPVPRSPPEPCPGPRSPPEPCAGPPLSAPLRSLSRKVSSLLRCAPRRRCPPLLLVLLVLITEVSLGTAASALHRRDKLYLFDAGRGEEDFYLDQSSNIYCRKCTADEVELSPCRATQNRQCACRNGTFCSPEHPCEMCQKCRPRCPKGEVELAPCTPSSDRRCGLPTTTSPGLSRDTGDLSGKPCSLMLLQRVIRFRSRSLGTHDNRLNERFSQDPLLSSAPGAEVMVPGTSQPSVKPRKRLVPVEGAEDYARLRSSFYTFAQKVPHDHWKRFGRALNLLENDIALAEKEGGLEVVAEMLRKWQEKETINVSVNTLLDTLHQINLGGVAEDIAFELVREGSFQYEVS
ncbi:tumor necrosis factor receptor superfamily member 10A-like isoform 2-T2 [Amazona ochrocephala]